MSIKSGITSSTPSNIPFGAGVYFAGLTYSELVAPTEQQVLAAIIGATQDGGTLTIAPEFFSPELDGKNVAVKELQQKVGESAKMDISIAEVSAANISKAVIGSVGNSTDTNFDVITSADLGTGHFYSGFGYYGALLDGRPFIVMFKNALCTSGMAMDAKNKVNSVFKGTFECQSDITYGVDKLPYAIFIRKATGWTNVPAEEVSSGTGSGTGED